VPFKEDDDRLMGPTTRSRWSYAASKAIDEFLGLAYYHQFGLPVVVARLFNTVGPRQTGQYGMVVPRFVRQALRCEPLTVYGDGSQSRCFAHVTDVTRALAQLLEHPAAVGEVFNVGATEEITIVDLARRVITGSPSNRCIPIKRMLGLRICSAACPDEHRSSVCPATL
jgi:UDP-glucose 4-epimerase